MEESGDEDDVPEGAVRFELDASDIEAALAEDGLEVEAREDVDVRILFVALMLLAGCLHKGARWMLWRGLEVKAREWQCVACRLGAPEVHELL